MPQKNVKKIFQKNRYYHVYNRGIDKRPIFLCHADYVYLIKLIQRQLCKFLLVFNDEKNLFEEVSNTRYFGDKIELYAYCLMPNHYHFLVKQISNRSMTRFIRSIFTSYVMYYNHKYSKSGRLFQNTYHAVMIKSQRQLNKTIEYIHENPAEITSDINKYKWSSKKDYINKTGGEWLKIGQTL